MSQKSFSVLKDEIDAAVNPAGGQPLNTGPKLNALLTSLATEVVGAGGPLQIAEFSQLVDQVFTAGQHQVAPATYTFAVGDCVTLNKIGLYQCVQAFTMHYEAAQHLVVDAHFPTETAYWQKLLDPGFDTFADIANLQARPGAGAYTVIVANPNVANVTTAFAATSLGGHDNTVAADTGAVVAGQHLTLPEGANNSVVIGGHDYTAPAQPDTVFVPRLSVWTPGAGVQLTDEKGTQHTLAVKPSGALTLDDRSVAGTPFVAYSAISGGEYNPETRVVPMQELTFYYQPDNLEFQPVREGGLVVPVSGLYEVTVHARVEPGQLTPDSCFGLVGGPVADDQFMTWTYGPPKARAEDSPVSAYHAQSLTLKADQTVYAFVQFSKDDANAKVACQLTVRLLNEL